MFKKTLVTAAAAALFAALSLSQITYADAPTKTPLKLVPITSPPVHMQQPAKLGRNQYSVAAKLPAQITVKKGERLQFLRPWMWVGSNVTVELKTRNGVVQRIFTQPASPKGWSVLAEFIARQPGTATIAVTYTAVVPHPVPNTTLIKLIVQ